MASFDAIYRARAMSVKGLTVLAFVPQVFGEVAVQVTTFLGGPPVGPSMGWVMFQGGNPEFPVWAGNLASGGDGGGGTGADEVWIGDDQPTDPGMELWYDSNALAPPLATPASAVTFAPTGILQATDVQTAIVEAASELNPSVAWGIQRRVGFASGGDLTPGAVETTLPLDSALTFTFLAGRMYRVGLMMRALRGVVQSSFNVKSGGALWAGMWVTSPGGWNSYDAVAFSVGDGATRTLTLSVTPSSTGLTIAGTGNHLYIEDCGPNRT